jgi:hypothetical protein
MDASSDDRRAYAMRLVVLTAVIVCAPGRPAGAATKTDVVELANGDRITCEIRRLERGKLTVKTDGIGTISIEWDDISRVSSAAAYDVEQASGRRVFGTLVRADVRSVDVVSGGTIERLSLSSIVRISPLGGTLWRRLDGAIDAGFSFTEANVQTQWNSHGTVSYRSRYWFNTLDAASSLTIREDANRQTRNTVALKTQRFLEPRWSVIGFAQFQQNEELSLNLRTAVGGGAERVLVHSNRVAASVLGGAAFTREAYEGKGDTNVAEAVAGLDWQWFTFDGRSTNLDLSVLSFTALNDDARQRLEINSAFKSDIVGDLYWSINVFESFNSQPPMDLKRNDFGVSATIGWSF